MKDFAGKIYRISPILIVFLAFFLSLWRVVNLPIAHDEALTVNTYVPQTYNFILGGGGVDGRYANNHPLNTVLEKFFISFLNTNEVVTRIPALIGLLMYLIATYYIVNLLFNKKWQITLAASFLSFHPFLIDYFSAARGYSLSLGLIMVGIALYLKAIKSGFTKYYILCVLGLLLVSLSATNNLNFIHVYLSVLVCHLLISDSLKRKHSVILFLISLIISLAPLLLVYSKNFATAYETGVFYVGGGGFWHETLPYLINMTTYNFTPQLSYKLIAAVFIITLIVGSWAVYKSKMTILYFLVCLSTLITLSIYLSNRIFNIPTVLERGEIFLIPIYSLFILSTWSAIEEKFHKRGVQILIASIVLFLTVFYITRIQFNHYYTWPLNVHEREVFNLILDNYKDSKKNDSVTIGSTWLFEPSLNFYRNKYSTSFVKPITRDTTTGQFDYYYLLDNFNNHGEFENMEEIKNKYDLKIIKHFDDIGSTLLVSPLMK